MTTLVWVLGAGGMLGRGLARSIESHPNWTAYSGRPLVWRDEQDLIPTIRENMRKLIHRADASGSHWCVIWAAGAAVNSTPVEWVKRELNSLRRSIDAIAEEAAGHKRGSFFFASSAGGVYGGSHGLPFTELTLPAALSSYGKFKLEAESYASALAERSGLAVAVGRITNIYGPGQQMDKMQGLVSHLASACLGRGPISIFVPLETTRDYIYVDDCARLVLSTMDRLAAEPASPGASVTKILGSGQGLSISKILGYVRSIEKRHLPVILGAPLNAAHQAVDLSVRSVVWPELDAVEKTAFAAGFRATSNDILRAIQRG
jgi:UDP-glucose 4-epimerase